MASLISVTLYISGFSFHRVTSILLYKIAKSYSAVQNQIVIFQVSITISFSTFTYFHLVTTLTFSAVTHDMQRFMCSEQKYNKAREALIKCAQLISITFYQKRDFSTCIITGLSLKLEEMCMLSERIVKIRKGVLAQVRIV